MKKIILLFLLVCLALLSKSQNKTKTDSTLKAIDSTVNLNLVQAPSSPAFNLLGISPSSIESPTDLNAFKVSIQNATNNFSKFPSNYAVEFAPASIFDIKSQTLDRFDSTNFKNVFWQSLNISFGLTHSNLNDVETNDSTSFTKLGFGIKFSIIRPHWNDSTQRYIDSIYHYQSLSLQQRESFFNNDPEIKNIDSTIRLVNDLPLPVEQRADSVRRLLAQRTTVQESLLKKVDSIAIISLRRLASGLQIKRKGGFLDFATGMVLDFPDNKFDNSMISKAGAWLTGGYENNTSLSILGIARYLYQPNKIFADDSGTLKTNDISTFDAGAKISFNGFDGKFLISTEALYRSVLNKNIIDPTWRLAFNASYDIGFNKILTLAIGKNFDGTITKSGNLIATLNFIAGFGSAKKIK